MCPALRCIDGSEPVTILASYEKFWAKTYEGNNG